MNRTVATLPLGMLLVAAVAACTPQAQAPQSASDTTTPATEQAGPAPAVNPTGRTGDTLTLDRAEGTRIEVTLERIISPATVTPGPAEPGKTYLAAALKLTDPDTRPLQGDVNVNATLTGSDGHTYSADLHNVTECTNFDAGMFHLDPGATASGCVVFALPAGVSPAALRYHPSEGFTEAFGEWALS